MAQVNFKLLQFKDKLNLPEEAKGIPDALLVMALTHPSGVRSVPKEYLLEAKKWGFTNYEYPEFVGDAILDVICVIAIHNLDDPNLRTPHASSKLKVGLVRNSHLACVMDARKLCNLVILRRKQDYEEKICADVFEAVIGVLYIYMQSMHGYNAIKILYNWIMKEWKFEDDLYKLANGETGECVQYTKLQTVGQELRGRRLKEYRREIGQEIEEGVKDQIRAEYEDKYKREFDVLREKYFQQQQEEKRKLEEELLDRRNQELHRLQELEDEYIRYLEEKTARLKELSTDDLKLQIADLQRELSSRLHVRPTKDTPVDILSKLYIKYRITKKPFFVVLRNKVEDDPTSKVVVGVLCPNTLDKCLSTVKDKRIIGIGEHYDSEEATQRASESAIVFLETEIIPDLEAIYRVLQDAKVLLDQYPTETVGSARNILIQNLYQKRKLIPKMIEFYTIKDAFKEKIVGIIRPPHIEHTFATIDGKDLIGIGVGDMTKTAEINAVKVAVVFLQSFQPPVPPVLPVSEEDAFLYDMVKEAKLLSDDYSDVLEEKEKAYLPGIVLANIFQKKRVPRNITDHVFKATNKNVIVGIVRPDKLDQVFETIDGIDIIGLGEGPTKKIARTNAIKSAVVFLV